MNESNDKPPFDQKRATSFVGKHVLIGMTYLDHAGTFLEQKQMHGTILRADAKKGFEVALINQNGERFWLPPDLRSFEEAAPGEYRLRATGEVVVDPDLICTWTVNRAPPDGGAGNG